MKFNLIQTTLSIIFSLLYSQYNLYSQTACGADYEEINNIVVIETENINTGGLWSIENSTSGFSGTGYIVWGNGNFFNSPGNGKFSVKIKINNTGVYRFQWRSKVGVGTSSTDENDTWLRFDDADSFWGEKSNGSIVFPVGRGTPNPNGAGSDGWFKVFSSDTTNWTWSTNTSDNDSHQIFVRFDSPGIYTMEISARSEFHFLDRIVLSKNVSDPTNLSHAETPCTGTLSTTDNSDHEVNIKVFPNPVTSSNSIYIAGIPRDNYSAHLFDISGRLVRKESLEFKNDSEEFYLGSVESGIYILKLNSHNSSHSVKLIVK
jgi:hypothetical protein